MVPSEKFNREARGFTTVWWLERGLKGIGGSRTLVSNWWLVNSFLGPKKIGCSRKVNWWLRNFRP
jgi:hypothetical protein